MCRNNYVSGVKDALVKYEYANPPLPPQPGGHDGPLSAAARDQLALPRVDVERGQRAEPPRLPHEGQAQQRRPHRQPRAIWAEEGRFNGARSGMIIFIFILRINI